MFNFLKKKQANDSSNPTLNIMTDVRHWYANRYNSAIVQRNILLVFVLLLLCSISISSIAIFKISKSRTIEPFVVEIEKKSGITTLVNPITVKQYSADEALNNYFITEYIRARELFDPNNLSYNYYTKVRLLSSQNVYYEFRNWIRPSNSASPINLYANVLTGDLKIRSLQHLRPGNVQIRFTLEFTHANGNRVKKDRIATLSFEYVTLEMNEQQRQINPLGFQITYYRADDEYL